MIPIERSLLFRGKQSKGNPEGISMLRGAYRPWFFKKRLEEFEAIGVERDLAGMPMARVPSDYIKAKKGTDKEKTYQAFKKMVKNVRRGDTVITNGGLVGRVTKVIDDNEIEIELSDEECDERLERAAVEHDPGARRQPLRVDAGGHQLGQRNSYVGEHSGLPHDLVR